MRDAQVLVPYKLTLLSNVSSYPYSLGIVLVPYKLTLLSNPNSTYIQGDIVLVPYTLTLLSNCRSAPPSCTTGFSPL